MARLHGAGNELGSSSCYGAYTKPCMSWDDRWWQRFSCVMTVDTWLAIALEDSAHQALQL